MTATEPTELTSKLVLTPASEIRPKPVRWMWKDRLAVGTLGLLAGREGQGKSTIAYWLAAQLTTGQLEGEFDGKPRAVLVCASEDSWEHTIVPRLIAAGADLNLVYRVEIHHGAITTGLSLPRDLIDTENAAKETGASLLLLDPLMSRLSSDLDSHRDGEVRLALEPLVALADRTRLTILGLIHFNKSGSNDPLQLVMASKAFTAVARSVHTVVPDPDDETGHRRLLGLPKSNLGRTDLPMKVFTIVSHPVHTPEGTAWTGKVEWLGEQEGTVDDVLRRANESEDNRSSVQEAADWLADYVDENGGMVASADVKRDGLKEGHTGDALKKARRKLNLVVEQNGFPRRTYWRTSVEQSEQQLEHPSWGESPTALTAPTGQTGHRNVQSEQSEQSERLLGDSAPTVCQVCGDPLDPQMAALGDTTHPGTCEVAA